MINKAVNKAKINLKPSIIIKVDMSRDPFLGLLALEIIDHQDKRLHLISKFNQKNYCRIISLMKK